VAIGAGGVLMIGYLFCADGWWQSWKVVLHCFWSQIAIAALIADYEDAVHTGALAPAHFNRNLWRNGLEFFWSQIAIAALLMLGHKHTEAEHGRWSSLDTWWRWFCSVLSEENN